MSNRNSGGFGIKSSHAFVNPKPQQPNPESEFYYTPSATTTTKSTKPRTTQPIKGGAGMRMRAAPTAQEDFF